MDVGVDADVLVLLSALVVLDVVDDPSAVTGVVVVTVSVAVAVAVRLT